MEVYDVNDASESKDTDDLFQGWETRNLALSRGSILEKGVGTSKIMPAVKKKYLSLVDLAL